MNNLGQKLSNTMADCLHSVFGKDDIFKQDYESTKLEAYISYGVGLQLPMKLPFGHRRLQYGLKRANKKDKTTFDRFVTSNTLLHRTIDDVVREANKRQKRARTLLTYTLTAHDDGRRSTIVFFSIQPEKQPVAFEDAVGRKYTLPFELCKNWEVSEAVPAFGQSLNFLTSYRT